MPNSSYLETLGGEFIRRYALCLEIHRLLPNCVTTQIAARQLTGHIRYDIRPYEFDGYLCPITTSGGASLEEPYEIGLFADTDLFDESGEDIIPLIDIYVGKNGAVRDDGILLGGDGQPLRKFVDLDSHDLEGLRNDILRLAQETENSPAD